MPGKAYRKGLGHDDYGPGHDFGGTARLTRGRLLAVFFYEGRHIYSLYGVRANHLLQRTRVDLVIPVRGPFGIGVAGEYFDRRTFFQDPTTPRRTITTPSSGPS